ncbi:MAG TPA: CAP domain-containing protein, partial [Actinomycetota bacterium]|nr:CAP domain-containing protein [Actinomycetota bacterium]
MRTPAVRGLMVAGVMGAMVVGGVAAPASASTNDPSCFVAAINTARGSAGVASLATNAALALIAQTWSGSMAAVGQISHNLNLPNLAPSNWIALGENVGVGPSCDSLAQAFMNSPEHKANIMNPAYSSVGVGVVITADGTVYVTEDFMGTGSPAPAPAPKPAPAPVTPPAPAPSHTTPPAPVPVPVVVHTTAPAPKPAPKPAPVTPAGGGGGGGGGG